MPPPPCAWGGDQKIKETNVIKMKPSAEMRPGEKQNCRGDEAGARRKQPECDIGVRQCMTQKSLQGQARTRPTAQMMSSKRVQEGAWWGREKKKKKRKKDGKPKGGRVIRGAAERGLWSRGKQWNIKQLWLFTSAGKYQQTSRTRFKNGTFFFHIEATALNHAG